MPFFGAQTGGPSWSSAQHPESAALSSHNTINERATGEPLSNTHASVFQDECPQNWRDFASARFTPCLANDKRLSLASKIFNICSRQRSMG
jgi:hypothetical protein